MRVFLYACFFVLISSLVFAEEELTLTAPIAKPATAKLKLHSFSYSLVARQWTITLLEPTTGETFTCTDDNTSAFNLWSNINTRNFSGANISLARRLINAANNKCPSLVPAGTFAGTPD